MGRALLLGFLLGPLPYVLWSTAIHRASRPDTLALNLGGLILTMGLLYALGKFGRRPVWVLCWLAILGTFFWLSVRYAIRHAHGPGEGALLVAIFPVTGYHALRIERGLLFVSGLLVWGFLEGFSRVLRRSFAPQQEHEEKPDEPDEPEEPPARAAQPYVVPRPPPKPKGPAQTPKSRPDTPPPQTRVPGGG